jgi:hypothetical protein
MELMMNVLYLVIARCPMDDVPMGVFEEKERAFFMADHITIDEVRAFSHDYKYINGTFSKLEPSYVISMDVIEFVTGLPIRIIYSKDKEHE